MRGKGEMRDRFGGLGLVCSLAWVALCGFPASVFGLSTGRVYELVSPVYKAGYGVNGIDAVAPDGEHVIFTSLGVFAGNPADDAVENDYVSNREKSEWATAPVNVPATLAPYSHNVDFATDLSSSLAIVEPGPNYTSATGGYEQRFFLHDLGLPDIVANFEADGDTLIIPPTSDESLVIIYTTSSPDFSHIVFEEPHGPLLREAVGTLGDLYDSIASTPGRPASLQFVGLNNRKTTINANCPVTLGVSADKTFNQFNALADGGEALFFSVGVNNECVEQLFVRLGGSKTLEVSRPLSKCIGKGIIGEVPCDDATARPSAQFHGANESGTRVFFTITAPLVQGDTDDTDNLYMADIECPQGGTEGCAVAQREVKSLTRVSAGTEPAEVQGVVVVANDGSRAYFVARGVLSNEPNGAGDAAVQGADNLYAYNSVSGGPSAFVGELCSGPEESGVVEDVRCPPSLSPTLEEPGDTHLWTGTAPEAQLSADGRYLVFSSYAQLVHGDTDEAKDVYRYDADTGQLIRVSVGEAGFDANGNGSGCEGGYCNATIRENEQLGAVYAQHDLNSRAVSGDGTRIVFTTSEPLSPSAVNGLTNVYEWHEVAGSGEGMISLVSSGSSDQSAKEVVISELGNDVFFKTAQGLVPQDTDGQSDVYDARLNGGFAQYPAAPQPCAGDACQGPLTNPVPLLVPGSVSQAPGGNFAPPMVEKKPIVKLKKKPPGGKKRSKGKKAHKKGKASARSGVAGKSRLGNGR